MKLPRILLTVAIGLTFLATSASAAFIGPGTPIPDADVLINFNGSGLDWVYAGPIAPNEFGPGNIQTPDFRASEGWRFATAAEWAIKPAWQDFTRAGFTVPPNAGWNDHSQYRFASEYWGNFNHVDLNDANDGRITNGLDIGSLTGVFETWYVRNTQDAAIPEPSTIAIWSLLGLVGLGYGLRKKRKAA